MRHEMRGQVHEGIGEIGSALPGAEREHDAIWSAARKMIWFQEHSVPAMGKKRVLKTSMLH